MQRRKRRDMSGLYSRGEGRGCPTARGPRRCPGQRWRCGGDRVGHFEGFSVAGFRRLLAFRYHAPTAFDVGFEGCGPDAPYLFAGTDPAGQFATTKKAPYRLLADS